jgi:hypothetical protein
MNRILHNEIIVHAHITYTPIYPCSRHRALLGAQQSRDAQSLLHGHRFFGLAPVSVSNTLTRAGEKERTHPRDAEETTILQVLLPHALLIPEYNIKVAGLTREPSLHERAGVFCERLEKVELRLGGTDGLRGLCDLEQLIS